MSRYIFKGFPCKFFLKTIGFSLFLFSSANSLFGVEEPAIVEGSESNSIDVAVTQFFREISTFHENSEPTTYVLIAGGMLMSIVIFRRKLGVNPEAD